MTISFNESDLQKQISKPVIEFSNAMGSRICQAVENGLTLVAVGNLEWSPCRATIYNWQDSHPDFAKMLGDAIRRRSRMWIEKITDDFLNTETEIETSGDDGDRIFNRTARVALLDKAANWLRWHADRVAGDRNLSDDTINVAFESDKPEEQINELIKFVADGKIRLSQADKLAALLSRSLEINEIPKLKALLEEQIKINSEKNTHEFYNSIQEAGY